MKQWIGVDWDHTLWQNEANEGKGAPMPGVREFLDAVHERGYKVIVHSCNRPSFIRQMCEEHNLPVDAIWGELPGQEGNKPLCAVYIDDRAVRFTTWEAVTADVLDFVSDHPIRR